MTATMAAEVAHLLDMIGSNRAIDIGGAAGALLFLLMRATQSLEGVVFYLPNVVLSRQRCARNHIG